MGLPEEACLLFGRGGDLDREGRTIVDGMGQTIDLCTLAMILAVLPRTGLDCETIPLQLGLDTFRAIPVTRPD